MYFMGKASGGRKNIALGARLLVCIVIVLEQYHDTHNLSELRDTSLFKSRGPARLVLKV